MSWRTHGLNFVDSKPFAEGPKGRERPGIGDSRRLLSGKEGYLKRGWEGSAAGPCQSKLLFPHD